MVGKTYPRTGMYCQKEGEHGVRNLPIITKVVDVKRSANFWSIGPSILADWIKNRYIKGQALNIIQVRPNVDSAIWKHILVQKEAIMEVLWNQLHTDVEKKKSKQQNRKYSANHQTNQY